MMGARTGDNNALVTGEKRDGLAHRKHPLSSSGAMKKSSSRPERSLPLSGPVSFIKVMIGAYTEALIIPPKARSKLNCLLDRNVFLEDAEMRTFLVKVSVFNGALAFRHGWDQFLSDHCIEYGEVVVFNYTKGLKFSVQIYGKTGCERTCFLRSCRTNLKRKRDELDTSDINFLHRGSKTFDMAKEHHISNVEATTREMSLDVALDLSNSDQPSCGAVTEPYVDGNICEKSGIKHDNVKKSKAYSAVNQGTIPSVGAVAKHNGSSNIPEKSSIQNDNLKKPQDCYVLNCDTRHTSDINLLHRGSKTFDMVKEHHISNMEATTREMSSDVALDLSNSVQPSCGAVTEPYVDGNICEKSGIQHDNVKKSKAYSAVNQGTIPADGSVAKHNVSSNIPEKSGIQNGNLKKPRDCYVLDCDTRPRDGRGIELKVNSNVPEKSSIEQDNSLKPHAYSVANCDTTPCELMVEAPTGNPVSKTGTINDPMAAEQGTDNLDNSFYYACIDLSKGSKVSKSVGSKANKMKGLKVNKKRDPSKDQLLSAMTSLKSHNMFREVPSTEMDMKEVVPLYSSIRTMDKSKDMTGKSVKSGLNEGKFSGDSKSDNLDRLAVSEGKIFLDPETGEGKPESSSICADNVNQSATAVLTGLHSRYLKVPMKRENIQASKKLLANTKVDKVPCVKKISTHSATNSTVRHSNEAATLLSGCDLEHPITLDGSSCTFIANEEGICFVIGEGDLIVEPDLSTIIPIEIDDSYMGTERCKEISPEHDHMSKRPFIEPQVEECFNDLQFSCHTKKHNEKQQGSTGCLAFENSHAVLPTEKAECVVDHPVSEPMKSPKCHEKNALVGESSQPAPEENKNKLVAHKGTVVTLVKVETVDSIVLSSISPVKLIFPIMIPAQPWLELPAALPFKGKKDGGKVVTFRDPCMRSWPVLYHESFRFIGFLGGWFALASANNLQPGDACELEVLAELDMILVHIKQ